MLFIFITYLLAVLIYLGCIFTIYKYFMEKNNGNSRSKNL